MGKEEAEQGIRKAVQTRAANKAATAELLLAGAELLATRDRRAGPVRAAHQHVASTESAGLRITVQLDALAARALREIMIDWDLDKRGAISLALTTLRDASLLSRG